MLTKDFFKAFKNFIKLFPLYTEKQMASAMFTLNSDENQFRWKSKPKLGAESLALQVHVCLWALWRVLSSHCYLRWNLSILEKQNRNWWRDNINGHFIQTTQTGNMFGCLLLPGECDGISQSQLRQNEHSAKIPIYHCNRI